MKTSMYSDQQLRVFTIH